MNINTLLETPASWAIAAVNVVWFLFVTTHGDTRNPDILLRFGALDRRQIWNEGESWRLVTACFLHIGWLHLLLNTYGLINVCQSVETHLGSVPFLLAYLMTGIGASAVSVLGHRAISAGASGAGFGMIGVVLMIAYRDLGSSRAFFSDPWVLSVLRTTGIWFVLGLFLRFDNYAHGGGFFFGLLAGYALTMDPGLSRNLHIGMLVFAIAVWIGVVLASLNPRFARGRDDY